MITVISGTNRHDSMTLRTAFMIFSIYKTYTEDVLLLSLQGKDVFTRNEEMHRIEEEYLIPADKFVFVMPEYNGSFPGVLKTMIDNSDIKKSWWHKKASLIGLSDGRAGNLRGLDHMTTILHYLKVNVHHNKVLLSRIKEELTLDGIIIKPETSALIHQQVKEFLVY